MAAFTARWNSSRPLSAATFTRAGVASCHRRLVASSCHCLASPLGTTSSGDLAGAVACAAVHAHANALVMQARTNSFGKLLNFFRLLESGDGEHVPVVSLQVGL